MKLLHTDQSVLQKRPSVENPSNLLFGEEKDLNFSICSFRGTSGGGTTLERAERAKDHLHTVGKSENCWSLPGTKHFLLMCNVKAEDAGEIRFVARDVESTAYLEVEGKSIFYL